MFTGGTFFGYKCPKCNNTVDIEVVAGSDKMMCKQCNVEMVPNEQGRTSAANVYCPNCKIAIGLTNSDRCSKCGGPFSSL